MKSIKFTLKRLIWISLLCLGLILFPLASHALNVQDVPNPRQINNGWVTDMANILSDSTETQLNQMISGLEATNGTEIAVVTVPDTAPAASPKAFTTELFNHWGIGKAGEDNGVLFLISVSDRRVEIETGYGVEPILPDAKVGNIIDTQITPKFKQGDFDGGVLAGTKALVSVLQGESDNSLSPTPSNELMSATQRGSIVFIGFGSAILSLIGYRQFKKISSPILLTPGERSRIKSSYNPERRASLIAYLGAFAATFSLTLFAVAITSKAYIGVVIGVILALAVIIFQLLLRVLKQLRSFSQQSQLVFIILLFFAIVVGWQAIAVISVLLVLIPGMLITLGYELAEKAGLAVSSALLAGSIIGVPVSTLLMKRYDFSPSLCCAHCHQPMQQVNSSLVVSHLTKPEKVAQELGSVRFKGWQCPKCSQERLLRLIHIRAYVVNSKTYRKCPTCQELTVTQTKRTVKTPTTYSTGKRLIIDQCHCCDYRKEKEKTIPRLPPPSSGSSGGGTYSGGYGSYSGGGSSSSGGGSSSSGGGSSSSGGFGGGDSGGGGAGGSW
ncbi:MULTISPECIES: TPM domain-containing protein [unclassified Coleofasciculus]|uniref:TPM domain-containing protein n=1 Tax=unclassified Coleofasciculus TaxID=2692782 RepID=UPI00188002E1|nr:MULTISPECIES: TPM domain-containing protein [unclassified Coleofasciculus]MBE9125065.1 TPM domain-containing protein [Coleofasciculus sp. LEGE 07081]MBE9151291.1 TPM domain-containing protein [Coleofasciculus sp. LEGE 07092]